MKTADLRTDFCARMRFTILICRRNWSCSAKTRLPRRPCAPRRSKCWGRENGSRLITGPHLYFKVNGSEPEKTNAVGGRRILGEKTSLYWDRGHLARPR